MVQQYCQDIQTYSTMCKEAANMHAQQRLDRWPLMQYCHNIVTVCLMLHLANNTLVQLMPSFRATAVSLTTMLNQVDLGTLQYESTCMSQMLKL